MDLFTPVVPKDKLHHNFKQTLAPGTEGVRAILSSWADGFVDRDGNFVVEFSDHVQLVFLGTISLCSSEVHRC